MESLLESIDDVLRDAEAIAADYADGLAASPWMPREKAAQIAEKVACVIPNVENRTADNLDGWVTACEAVAAAIRSQEHVRLVNQAIISSHRKLKERLDEPTA